MNYRILRQLAIDARQHDIMALEALRSVYDGYLPWSNSALRPAAIQIVLNDILLNRRRIVVEFGTGISTVYIAEMVSRCGAKLVTVDNNEAWQHRVGDWMRSGAKSVTEFVHAPLVAPYEDSGAEWYDSSIVEAALGRCGPVDLVIFDGPPAYMKGKELSRMPGLSAVSPFLSPQATIILDDITRSGEQEVARAWSIQLGRDCRVMAVEAGVAIWVMGEGFNITY